jgi:hypothetical protein
MARNILFYLVPLCSYFKNILIKIELTHHKFFQVKTYDSSVFYLFIEL